MIRPDYREREYWTVEEFADYLGMTVATVRRRVEENHGFPRPFQDGRIVRFHRSEVLEYCKKKRSDV